MQNLLQNLRYGLRTLYKNPGLTLTVLLTLALGIGANTAIFTIDYATLLAPLPYAKPVEWQIVGVFHNVQYHGFRQDYPEIDVPVWQTPWSSAGIGVRTAQDSASMIKSIAAAVHAVDPQIALATPRTMDQVRDDVLANDRFTLILFASFAAISLLLASVGIYGVMAFSVAQRSHEIAVRMALGANRLRVVGLVVKEGIVLACAGLGLGLIGAYLVGLLMRSALFGVEAIDLPAFALVALILLFSALLACYLPAYRAASVEPMQILRAE